MHQTRIDMELNELPQQTGSQLSTVSECRVPPLTLDSTRPMSESQAVDVRTLVIFFCLGLIL